MATDFIALDWGTTSFRSFLVSADGSVRDRRASADGIMSVKDDGFETLLERNLAGWDRALPVLASGMITSRQGWREVAYVPAPAGVAQLATGVARFETAAKRQIIFVPGITVMGEDGIPDVMRGEETQIIGALSGTDGIFVMRGTHCKWVRVANGKIVQFATFMTGEMFAVLKEHSILGRLMTGEAAGGSGFERGVRKGLASPSGGAGLLHDLFSARTLGLFGTIAGDQLAPYLSGLLIGSEIAGASGVMAPGAAGVTVIGAPALADPFRRALKLAGIAAAAGPEDAAVRGLAKIGRQIGVIT